MRTPTLYVRDTKDKRRTVTRIRNTSCLWVFDGEGAACVMYDGLTMLHNVDHAWWLSRIVKANTEPPQGFWQEKRSSSTGRRYGWEPIKGSPNWPQFVEAAAAALAEARVLTPGYYSLCGPTIARNLEGLTHHRLLSHAIDESRLLCPVPTDYDELRAWMRTFPRKGVVWRHPDGRTAEIRKRDFPK